MKLYRGLKSSEFVSLGHEEREAFKGKLKKILELREEGDLGYPEALNSLVLELARLQRLAYQHFTDDQEIAYRYAEQEGGILIEIDVCLEDILEYFTVEFQNFSGRRKKFELVYVVKGSDLKAHEAEWNLRTINLSEKETI